jgi:hypothetical protein
LQLVNVHQTTIGDWKRRTNLMSLSCLNTKVALLSEYSRAPIFSNRHTCQGIVPSRRDPDRAAESSVLCLWWSATINHGFRLLLELSRELTQLFERLPNGRQGTAEVV